MPPDIDPVSDVVNGGIIYRGRIYSILPQGKY